MLSRNSWEYNVAGFVKKNQPTNIKYGTLVCESHDECDIFMGLSFTPAHETNTKAKQKAEQRNEKSFY